MGRIDLSSDLSPASTGETARESTAELVPPGALDSAHAQQLLGNLEQLSDEEVERVLHSLSSKEGNS